MRFMIYILDQGEFLVVYHWYDHLVGFVFILFYIQGIQEAKKHGREKFTIIWDREGFTKERNFDGDFHEAINEYRTVVEYNYMERVHKVYVLHVEWYFRMMYALAKPLMHKKTTDKLEILSDVRELKRYFDDENLLVEHGGLSDADREMNEIEKKNSVPVAGAVQPDKN